MYDFHLLLLNLLIVVFPFFVYQFFVDKVSISRDRHAKVVAMLMSGSVLLCLAFPYETCHGYMFDLRIVPLLFSFLYGGYRAGLTTTAVFIVGRWLVGGEGFYVSLVSYVLSLGLIALGMPRWAKYRGWVKRVWGAGYVTLWSLITLGVHALLDPQSTTAVIPYLRNMWVIDLFTLLLCIQLIEHIQATERFRVEMIRAEKLQVISELAASIAHEVRNPMTAARGFSQLLAESPNMTSRQVEHLQMIQSELDRAHEIINDYLSFARPQLEETRELQLDTEIQHVLGIISPYASLQGVSLQYEMPKDPIWITGNSGQLAQALVNIVKNAIESHPSDGIVQIKVQAKGPCASIDIIDSGCGMTPNQTKNLGTPFYSTKSNGTGLGLMTTYRIVQRLEGTIAVQSEPGKGTTFTVVLPRKTKISL